MKIKQQWHLNAGFVALCGAMIFLVIILALEAYFFSKQAREIVRLKEDYASYVQGLKRMIAEYQDRERELGGVKKKIMIEPAQQFSFVNRDPHYLRRCARAYSQAQRVGDASQTDQSDQQPARKQRRTKKKKQRQVVRRQQQRAVAFDGDLDALSNEYQFQFPLDQRSFWISSPFGPRRNRNRQWGFHYGLDMAAPYGTPVKAVAHGVVVEAARARGPKDRGFGNTVVISHSNKLKTRYAHLSRIDVAVGDTVERGQRVGAVGNSGNTRGRNGVHLHLEVLVYGKRVDPLYFFNQLRRTA